MNIRDSQGGGLDIHGRTRRWPLLIELFVAFSLFVAFFFLVKNYFVFGNPMSGNVFMAGSEKLYRLDQPIMSGHWNGRLSGLLLSGALMDFSLDENGAHPARLDQLANVFGLYHACWLLMLFVVIIFALRHSLFINLGIFAGMIYDFSPISGPFFYPWDMPAMLFFTLAVLFFERRQIWMMTLAICAGTFFKETVLVCALLVLFAGHWKWKKRAAVFIGMLAFYIIGKGILLNGLLLNTPAFSMGDAATLGQAFNPLSLMDNFFDNLKVLFLPTFNSVFFANAGTVLGVLVLCWQKRFLPYMVIVLAYLAGLVFLPLKPPGITEVRVFMQILPLSIMLLSVLWMDYSGISPAGGSPALPLWPVRETFSLLLPIVIALVALSTSIAAMQYYVIYEDLQPANQAQSQLGRYIYKGGKTSTLEALSHLYQNGYADTQLKLAINAQADHRDADAIVQYQRVLDVDANSIYALNNLATLLATDSEARLRDGARAVSLAQRACELSHYQEPALIYTLAAADAEAGRFADALAAAQKARTMALAQGQAELVQDNEPLVELYKSGHPFHQQPALAPQTAH